MWLCVFRLGFLRNWMAARHLEHQKQYAGSHYALAVTSGDERRAARLRAVIEDLHKENRA